MIVKKIFELPMLSSLLNHEPELLIRGLDISMILDGKDLSDANRHVCLSFKNVLCHKHTSERFTAEMYDAYDTVVEIVDSEWLMTMKKMNVTPGRLVKAQFRKQSHRLGLRAAPQLLLLFSAKAPHFRLRDLSDSRQQRDLLSAARIVFDKRAVCFLT